MSLLGLDLGTTGCKAVIFDLNGKVLAQEYVEYQFIHRRKGWSELDPNLVWQSAKSAIKSSAQKVRYDAIEALSISCQGEAVIPVDRGGRALHNAIVSFDERTRPQAEWWNKKVGREKLFKITGMPLHPMYAINKVMWFRENMPQIFSNTWKFLCFEDYLFLKLGLPPTIDYSLAARTMTFDLQKRTWSDKILSWANLDQNLFSNVKPSGDIVGKVDKGVAKELGLGKSVIAVTGGHDQPCGALGAGVLSEGIAMNATGTSDTTAVALKKPLINDLMLSNNYPCYNHVPKNTYIITAFNLTGGLLLRWYRDTLCKEEIREAKNAGRDVYELIIERASTEPASIFILPHFVGSGTPTMDSRSKGAILGLTLGTTKADLSKAVLDSLCYEMRINLDTLKGIGVDVEEIRIIGGGAKSKIWSQLKANIYGIRVVSLEVSEAACLGAAILAGTAIGHFSSIHSAVNKMVRVREIFYPCRTEFERYIEKYQMYRKVYPQLAKLNHEMN